MNFQLILGQPGHILREPGQSIVLGGDSRNSYWAWLTAA